MKSRQIPHVWRQRTITNQPRSRPCVTIQQNRLFSRAPPRAYDEIAKCPSADCSCASIPADLEIDHETLLRGRTPFYSTHLVTCTRRSDWTSKVEDDPRGWLVKDLKDEYIKGEFKSTGVLQTPLISCSSFRPPLSPDATKANSASLYVFPQFKYVKFHKCGGQAGLHYRDLDKVLDTALHLDQTPTSLGIEVHDVDGYAILICGHGGRDQRCGIIAPLLTREFRMQLRRRNFVIEDNPPSVYDDSDQSRSVRIAQISHIGGHKWAGNVIIYVSPRLLNHPLAGKGVWLGRVAPQHVQGVVSEIMIKGRVIGELLRGVVDFNDAR